MIRMWRNIHLFKRGGRAHEETGVMGTAPGELAVLCPACPYPDINLPDDWEFVPSDQAYVRAAISLSTTHSPLGTASIRILGWTHAFVSNATIFPAI